MPGWVVVADGDGPVVCLAVIRVSGASEVRSPQKRAWECIADTCLGAT